MRLKIGRRVREGSQAKAIDQRIESLKKHQEKLRDEIIEMEGKVRTWGIPLRDRVLLRRAINQKEGELSEVRGKLAKLISSSIK